MEPLLDLKQICEYLGVSRDTVFMLANTDTTFPARKIAYRWKCDGQALKDWVANLPPGGKQNNVVEIQPRRGRPCLSKTAARR